MSTWQIQQFGKKPVLKAPIFVEGLPGIGNVGKVAVDFIVDEIHAKKLFEITSPVFPNAVFVTEDNLIDLPKVEIFYKSGLKRDLLFMTGDVQPIDEASSYAFSEKILELLSGFKVKEIITLGGIGLSTIPRQPKVFCTGNSRRLIKEFIALKVKGRLYGVVGPIVGISGLLLGLARKRDMDAVTLLAETFGHPMYLGVKGAKEILKVLNKKFSLNISPGKLEKEIKQIEMEMLRRTDDLKMLSEKGAKALKGKGDVNYIG
ncbi:PAC2 family protein [Candidatus Woesearchaeota archaeon]|nr:PAC2 family protein [Candidatus Woesearchaeota archaeon]